MIESALGILAASVLGSVHCAGMCGAFVCFYTGSANENHSQSLLHAHVLYNVGRLVSYVLLGVLAGGLGAGITHAGTLAGIANTAAILSGALMIGWGVVRVAALKGIRMTLPLPQLQLPLQRALGSVLQRIRTQPVSVRAALTGLFTTLLPCGWLYVFVTAAAGTGSAKRGALVMAIFWLGNVPALVAVGVGAQRAFGSLQRSLPLASALAITGLGMVAILGHLNLTLVGMSHAH